MSLIRYGKLVPSEHEIMVSSERRLERAVCVPVLFALELRLVELIERKSLAKYFENRFIFFSPSPAIKFFFRYLDLRPSSGYLLVIT